MRMHGSPRFQFSSRKKQDATGIHYKIEIIVNNLVKLDNLVYKLMVNILVFGRKPFCVNSKGFMAVG